MSTKFVLYTTQSRYVTLAELLDQVTASTTASAAAKKAAPVAVYDVLLANMDKVFALPASDAEAIISQAFSAFPELPGDAVSAVVARLATAIAAPASASQAAQTKLGLLVVLYNTLGSDSLLRYDVFRAILTLARAASLGRLVAAQLGDLAKLAAGWALSPSQLAELNKLAADAVLASATPATAATAAADAQAFLYAYLEKLTPETASAAAEAGDFARFAALALAYALRSPAPAVTSSPVAAYDALAALPVLAASAASAAALAGTPATLLAAVRLLATGSVAEYVAFAAAPAVAEAYAAHGVDAEAVLLNARAVNLAAAVRAGSIVKYDDAAAVACPDAPAEVEEVLVDIIALGQIGGRLNQQTRTVRVDRVVPRSFTMGVWKELSERVTAWSGAVGKAIVEAPVEIEKNTIV